jgi:hypothetical protein
MKAFDARHGFRTQSFVSLSDGALNLLFRRFQIVEGSSKAVADSVTALTAAEDHDGLTAPQRVAAMIGLAPSKRATVRALPGKKFRLDRHNPSLPLTAQQTSKISTEHHIFCLARYYYLFDHQVTTNGRGNDE